MKLLNNLLKTLLKDVKAHEMVTSALLLVYILSNMKMPHMVSKLVSSLVGIIVVLMLGLYLFMHLKNALGFLCLVSCV